MSRKPQRQDSLHDQLKDLIPIANREGMYDAADYLSRISKKIHNKTRAHTPEERSCLKCGKKFTALGKSQRKFCHPVNCNPMPSEKVIEKGLRDGETQAGLARKHKISVNTVKKLGSLFFREKYKKEREEQLREHRRLMESDPGYRVINLRKKGMDAFQNISIEDARLPKNIMVPLKNMNVKKLRDVATWWSMRGLKRMLGSDEATNIVRKCLKKHYIEFTE